ncbi:MAG: NADPH-dependent oxidoreductase [Microbacteriaceae bacterium]|jgi:nitroreductase|nr:NADPH-dependent oxidoreductase [Microbacteriaceae bacterium]
MDIAGRTDSHVEGSLNTTIETQLAHRTIRAFTDEPLEEAQLSVLLDVARRAPTSSFYQQTTILRIEDPQIRETVYQASGQPYVGGELGTLLIFVVDLYRNARIREEAGVSTDPLETMPLFLQGVEDTVLAAQNLVVAAESLGLGTVYLGSIGGDPRSLISALHLPERTYPLVGLLVGHPAQSPQLKPRLPLEISTGTDTYPAQENFHVSLREYDATVHTYYDLRDTSRRVDSFTHQMAGKLGTGRAELAPVLEVLHEQRLALR